MKLKIIRKKYSEKNQKMRATFLVLTIFVGVGLVSCSYFSDILPVLSEKHPLNRIFPFTVSNNRDKIYLFGGFSAADKQIHCYQDNWVGYFSNKGIFWQPITPLVPPGQAPPCGGFGVTGYLVDRKDNEYMVIHGGVEMTDIGGFLPFTQRTNHFSIWNITGNYWLPLGDSIRDTDRDNSNSISLNQGPEGRYASLGASAQGNFYLFGGFLGQITMSDLWRYNINCNCWTKLSSPQWEKNITPLYGGVAAILNQNQLVIFGQGYHPQDNILKTVGYSLSLEGVIEDDISTLSSKGSISSPFLDIDFREIKNIPEIPRWTTAVVSAKENSLALIIPKSGDKSGNIAGGKQNNICYYDAQDDYFSWGQEFPILIYNQAVRLGNHFVTFSGFKVNETRSNLDQYVIINI